jgi:acyl-CoA synthetase (AMP-forming)/AMP-acid ligase II
MYPGTFAETAGERPAIIMGATGEIVTYEQLRARSNRFSRYLRDIGLGADQVVAILMDNNPRYHEVAWGTRQVGRYFTPVNTHLTADEVAYIVNDSAATVIVANAGLADVACGLTPDVVPNVTYRLLIGGELPGWESYDSVVGRNSADPVADETEGDIIQYSSGTTGKPKGIRRALTGRAMNVEQDSVVPFLRAIGFGEGHIYLSPAPLYHSAPIYWTMGVHRLGGTVVVMEKFDPEQALALIERHRITHTQMVPTMFIRMLKLDPMVRARYDVSSLQRVIHAAAPCPVDVKRQMIEWWGPIISEFYSSSEGAGATFVTAPEWLEHPGTVGKAMLGTIHILDDAGEELPTGEIGTIWAEGAPQTFEYINDAEKTREQRDARGWVTVGDVGYLDADGYLYLTDRKAYMIISGGVNIYPQEAEDVLVAHPKVLDVAVLGIPDPDFGEQVKGIVQPVSMADAGPELEAELIAYCRSNLASYKCPRSIDFDAQLPRSDAGKLYKRRLKDRYWNQPAAGEPVAGATLGRVDTRLAELPRPESAQ